MRSTNGLTRPRNKRSRWPRYKLQSAAQSYSNIAAVLAGFAFAAIVLVVQGTLPQTVSAHLLRGYVAIAFLVAFFGCIVSAFNFALVTGEELVITGGVEGVAPRTHIIALLGGAGFAVSTIFIFWGMVLLARLFLPEDAVRLTYAALIGIILLANMLLTCVYVDYLIVSKGGPRFRDFWQPIAIGGGIALVGLLIGMLMRLVRGSNLIYTNPWLFAWTALAALILVIVGAGLAMVIAEASPQVRFSSRHRDLWIGLHGCIFAALLALLP